MSRFKKRLLIVIAVVCMMFQLPATGMPVIDVSAIAQAVTQYVTTIQNWNQQLQHWKEEYDRLKDASAKIVSGDFTSVVQGVANLAGQMAGWAEYAKMEDAAQFGYNIKTGGYSLLSLITDSKLLLANWDVLEEQFDQNIKRIEESARNDAELAGDATFAFKDFSLKTLTSAMTNIGNMMQDGASLYNSVAENINALFFASPNELAGLYENTMQKGLEQEGYTSYEDLKKKMSDKKNEILKLQGELTKIDPSTSQMQYSQKQSQIEIEKTYYEKMETLENWYRNMQKQKEEILKNQETYDDITKEEAEEKQKEKLAKREAELEDAYNDMVKINQQRMQQRLNELAFGLGSSYDNSTTQLKTGGR